MPTAHTSPGAITSTPLNSLSNAPGLRLDVFDQLLPFQW
jgi:hypothetical protein